MWAFQASKQDRILGRTRNIPSYNWLSKIKETELLIFKVPTPKLPDEFLASICIKLMKLICTKGFNRHLQNIQSSGTGYTFSCKARDLSLTSLTCFDGAWLKTASNSWSHLSKASPMWSISPSVFPFVFSQTKDHPQDLLSSKSSLMPGSRSLANSPGWGKWWILEENLQPVPY